MPLDIAENLPVTRGEDAIVADPDKPTREYVLGKQIQEAHNAHAHDTMFTATLVLLVVVGYLFVGQIQYSGIGDGHPISIAPDVLEYLTDAFCRRT